MAPSAKAAYHLSAEAAKISRILSGEFAKTELLPASTELTLALAWGSDALEFCAPQYMMVRCGMRSLRVSLPSLGVSSLDLGPFNHFEWPFFSPENGWRHSAAMRLQSARPCAHDAGVVWPCRRNLAAPNYGRNPFLSSHAGRESRGRLGNPGHNLEAGPGSSPWRAFARRRPCGRWAPGFATGQACLMRPRERRPCLSRPVSAWRW